jgi:proline iminopeptidase
MAAAKLAPNLPEWMVEHANRYLSSGGTDGHLYKVTQPGRPQMTVPSLLLTTTGRKSGKKFVFPLFYGEVGDSYFVVASKGGAPHHPGWYRNILANLGNANHLSCSTPLRLVTPARPASRARPR